MTVPCNIREAPVAVAASLGVSIAILAGGKSQRFGADKALTSLVPGGPPLLQLVIDHLRGLTDDLFIVASDRPEYELFDLPVYPDRWTGMGPLGGIGAALTVSQEDRCFITSCDMPFLNPNLIRWMCEQVVASVVAPLLPGTSRQGGYQIAQTLHAIYRKECLDEIDRMLLKGERRVSALLDRVPTVFLDAEDVAAHDPGFWSFLSVNTPDTLLRARAHWRSLQGMSKPQLY